VVSKTAGVEIADALRDIGFGVTEFPGYGRDGSVEILNSVVQRNRVSEVLRVIEKWDENAFVTVEEPKILRGGNMGPPRDWRLAGPWVMWKKERDRA